MNLFLFYSALRARIGMFALVVCATVLAAIVGSLLMPKSYKATTALLVDAKDAQSLSSNGPAQFSHPLEKVTYMQTQMDIIGSETVARRVVRDLKLAENPALIAAHEKKGAAGGPIEESLARDLLLGLKVEGSQSSIINVSYS